MTSRIWFTAAQKAELWERWKNGQSAAAISRALERKNKTGVERIAVLHAGSDRRRALRWAGRSGRCSSINVRERPWASKRQPIDYKRCCTDLVERTGAQRTFRQLTLDVRYCYGRSS